ncbi:MAG: amino acid ABC transporter substrate-binding protein [Azonexus sp.]|jgi:ABC-type amino acid transport substrate-binding protein
MFRLRFLAAAAAAIALAVPAASADTLQRIKARKSISMGYREASVPFSYVGEGGQPIGYSVELCTKVARAIQDRLKLAKLEIKWVRVEPGTRVKLLKKGVIDLECGSTTATLSRRKEVDFSLLTFADGGSYIAGKASGIASLADLKGRRTGVAAETTTERTLKSAMERGLFATELVLVKDHADGLKLLNEGKIDAYASDRGLLAGLVLAAGKQDSWQVGSEMFSYEPYALMMRRDDPDFRLAVDTELARIYRTGELFEIYDRWFGAISKPGPLLDSLVFLLGLPE